MNATRNTALPALCFVRSLIPCAPGGYQPFNHVQGALHVAEERAWYLRIPVKGPLHARVRRYSHCATISCSKPSVI
ncbi:hypothetical protein OBBRIDRAFT_116144 [Obba rivulosa]|uniref:Uncharacterized protein n=1 Tax=Obba rivulosa TaxID=1052685 RepID=A0A8E2ANM1_9APHY|nr:hypothetical protein OBBRIDRAFT_116144 [Obba rivulosa]